MNIIISVIILIVVCILTLIGVVWKTKRACLTIIRDLQDRGAYDPESAATLPYVREKGFRHFGVRDYKPQALLHLIKEDIIRVTDNGRCYLDKKTENIKF